MAVTPDKVQIGTSADYLDGVSVDTAAGTGLFRETVVAADPENGEALARVRNTTPAVDDYGSVVRVAGSIDTGLTQPTTPDDTQPVSVDTLPLPTGAATEAKQLPDNHQVTVSNFPATQPVSGTVTADLGALNGAATAANQATGNASLSSVDGKLPDLSGTWGYDAGGSGSVTIGAGKRVLQITAVAGGLGATLTINGGATVTIPALTSITIEPRGNLTAPSLVFTGTSGYFVEHVS